MVAERVTMARYHYSPPWLCPAKDEGAPINLAGPGAGPDSQFAACRLTGPDDRRHRDRSPDRLLRRSLGRSQLTLPEARGGFPDSMADSLRPAGRADACPLV